MGVGTGRGLIGTVVGNESYALYDDGTTVRVVHVGDAIGKLTVVAVDAEGMRFSDGSRAGLIATEPSNVIAPLAPHAGILNDPAAIAPPSVGNAPALSAPTATGAQGGARTYVVGAGSSGSSDGSSGPRTFVVAPRAAAGGFRRVPQAFRSSRRAASPVMESELPAASAVA